jgi:hypothetical protein
LASQSNGQALPILGLLLNDRPIIFRKMTFHKDRSGSWSVLLRKAWERDCTDASKRSRRMAWSRKTDKESITIEAGKVERRDCK